MRYGSRASRRFQLAGGRVAFRYSGNRWALHEAYRHVPQFAKGCGDVPRDGQLQDSRLS
jgi:hypothetical protein